MTPARQRAHERGLMPHYKVRVVVGNFALHFASWDEPTFDHESNAWGADWIKHPEYGDEMGYIDWSAISAITWRWCE